jgi:hypothetical protein
MPRVADALTLYAWREPAVRLASWAGAVEVPPVIFLIIEALLSLLAFALFWHGRYWLGLATAVLVMIVSLATVVAERSAHGTAAERRLRRAAEVVFPLLWWWAWAHGLVAYGKPLDPVSATMVLWVVVGGTIAIDVVEALSVHRFAIEIHAWRPFDSRFRLISASRNTDLAILAVGLLLKRPDTGFMGVAWWTLISLIIHSVRLAQLTELQARRQKIESWLDR